MNTELDPVHRRQVLHAIYRRLARECPECVPHPRHARPGGSLQIEDHLNRLIEISRRTSADFVEPYLAEIQDEVCVKCPNQQPSGHCPLRYEHQCVLYDYADVILLAIGQELQREGDPDYQSHHPPTI